MHSIHEYGRLAAEAWRIGRAFCCSVDFVSISAILIQTEACTYNSVSMIKIKQDGPVQPMLNLGFVIEEKAASTAK